VAQVRAPALLNPLLARLGINAVVVPVQVRPPDLAAVVRALARTGSVDGLLVTVPHKAAVCALADKVGPAATLIGTANALRREPDGRWRAENFDGLGFVRGLTAAGHAVRGRRVALTGAGGAGRAIAAALLSAGAARISVTDADRGRQDALLRTLATGWPGLARPGSPVDMRDADILVNATPLGMRPGDPLPFDPADGRPGAVVADIVMEPHDTALLRAAAALNQAVHHGINMLQQQVPCYCEFFGWE
jgi:shikimate dehydrogenase